MAVHFFASLLTTLATAVLPIWVQCMSLSMTIHGVVRLNRQGSRVHPDS